MKGPLANVRVIEVGHMLMGPYCGMLLADLGAEVIKIEPPEGDIARQIGPNWIGPHNAYFASLNRSKKSIVLDLQSEDGQRALGELAASARSSRTCARRRSASSGSPTTPSSAGIQTWCASHSPATDSTAPIPSGRHSTT